MPLEVPHRHPCKHHRLVAVAERNAEGLPGWTEAEPNDDDWVIGLRRPGVGPNQLTDALLFYGFDSACNCSMITLARVA